MLSELLIFSLIAASSLHFNALPPEKTGVNVKTICQDKEGRMWFGGVDGITCYDGTDYTVFRHGHDISSIPDNHIYKLFCDSEGKLWVGHISGLSLFDGENKGFIYYPLQGGIIIDIIELDSNRLLLINRESPLLFDKHSKTFSKLEKSVLPDGFRARCLYRSGSFVYIGGMEGIIYETDTDCSAFSEVSAHLQGSKINCFLRTGSDSLYIGTEGRGLWRFSDEKTVQVDSRLTNIRSLCEDDSGRIWAGTKNGLLLLDHGQSSICHYKYKELGCITHDSICAIFKDSQGSIWLGTYYGGVCCNIRQQMIFSPIKSGQTGDFPHNTIISDIVEDDDGHVWVGTNSGNLERIGNDCSVGHFELQTEENTEAIDVKCIFKDKSTGRIYVGADRAPLYYLEKDGQRFKKVGGNAPADVYDIEEDNGRGMFLGSLHGLYYYDKKSGNFSRLVLASNLTNIKALKMDSDGNLWIGRKFGACAINWESGKQLETAKELDSLMYVEDFLEDSKGKMWISSNEGLVCYDKSTLTARTYSTGDGLPDDVVHGAEEDDLGRIWISTNCGLCCLNPENGSVRTFSVEDGLPIDRFSVYAHCRTSRGEMFFGGIHGLCHFNPNEPFGTFEAVAPTISSVEVNGTRNFPINGTMEFQPDERNVTIWFTASDYISGSGGKFYYRIDGLNENWREAGAERKAEYFKMPAGKYTFTLRYRNSAGLECDSPAELQLVFKPHWYETLTAKISALFLFCLLLAFCVSRLLSRKEAEYKTEMSRMRSDLLREFSLEFVKIGANGDSREDGESEDLDKNDEAFMRKAMKVVKENLDNSEFSIDDFAEAMNMSRSNLHLRVKKLFKVSSLEFIKTIRFNEACRLLLEKDEPISEIGYKVGFATPSYFASAFKRFMGCTPSEYVDKYNKEQNKS